MNNHKLSQDAVCAGCAAKLNQTALEKILKDRDFFRSEDVLIGPENFEDSGVYRIAEDRVIVQSTDFFPPIVDDAYQFGQIATANALSDIYVMGAEPITALNICCFPTEKYPTEVFTQIIDGSIERLRSAKCSLLGGHTIEDTELKFGIAATGIAKDSELLLNKSALPGDLVFLSKPLGTGIATTAIKANICPSSLRDEITESMIKLNIIPQPIKDIIHAATDITGFGLSGHLLELAKASNVNIQIQFDSIPVFKGIFDLIDMGMMPAGSFKNKENNFSSVQLNDTLNTDIIFDAQTSGGVLFTIPEKHIDIVQAENFGTLIGKILENTNSDKLIEIIQ